MSAAVKGAFLWEENSAKSLGIIVDSALKFKDHAKVISKKASQKLAPILRVSNFVM